MRTVPNMDHSLESRRLSVCDIPFSDFKPIGDSSATECIVGGLQHSTFYQFVLRGVNECGPGPVSHPSEPTRTLGAPTVAPAKPVVSAATEASVHLEWRENELGEYDSPITGFVVCWGISDETGKEPGALVPYLSSWDVLAL